MTDILGKDIYFEKTLQGALKDMCSRIKDWMTSHKQSKIELMNRFRDTYSDKFPEVFV